MDGPWGVDGKIGTGGIGADDKQKVGTVQLISNKVPVQKSLKRVEPLSSS